MSRFEKIYSIKLWANEDSNPYLPSSTITESRKSHWNEFAR